jgi:hypothetical protein
MRRRIVVAVLSIVLVVMTAGPALATHDHFVETPNGNCHQVAQGQTSIDVGHGGYHRFHFNVHLGAADGGVLGHGNSGVHVYKDACPT